MDEGDHLLLYTDGVWETLADEDGRAEERFTDAIEPGSEGGAPLLDAILADVHHELAGRPQPDDLTLLTATLGPRLISARSAPAPLPVPSASC